MSTVAIIGAAGGIGRVLVDELSANGSNVIALDLPTSLRAHPLKCTSIPIDIYFFAISGVIAILFSIF